MNKNKEKVLNALHDLVGLCQVCGAAKCKDKKSWSRLPERILTKNIIKALDKAFPET